MKFGTGRKSSLQSACGDNNSTSPKKKRGDAAQSSSEDEAREDHQQQSACTPAADMEDTRGAARSDKGRAFDTTHLKKSDTEQECNRSSAGAYAAAPLCGLPKHVPVIIGRRKSDDPESGRQTRDKRPKYMKKELPRNRGKPLDGLLAGGDKSTFRRIPQATKQPGPAHVQSPTRSEQFQDCLSLNNKLDILVRGAQRLEKSCSELAAMIQGGDGDPSDVVIVNSDGATMSDEEGQIHDR
ncbi:Hypothetical protein D9617_17g046240 [Elsinoe fawcettii]|nr:Hypothetical protein D9617_17g046240 [Elsinoe fawcettii]